MVGVFTVLLLGAVDSFFIAPPLTVHHSSSTCPSSAAPLPRRTQTIRHDLHQLLLSTTSATGASTAKTPKGGQEAPEEKVQDDFDWYKSWYPLVPIGFLDLSKPHKFCLLGMDVVVWNDGAQSETYGPKKKKNRRKRVLGGQWRAFEDKCPHRLVPLSEGRIESDGSLLCSYHGWRFDGTGECISLEGQPPTMTVRDNPKSKCNSFPVKVVNDVLWVWPDSGPDATLVSELTPLPIMANLKDEDGNPIPEENIIYNTYNFRELPYSADYFLENVVDPAHVPVSHHGVVGNRYTDVKPINLKTKEPMTKNGFVLENVGENGRILGHTELKAPCHVSIDSFVNEDGARQIIELYVSPSRPGFCNHLGRLVLVKGKNGNLPSGFKQFTLPLPVWMNHLLAATFLNQDALFLHAQERNFHHDLSYKTSRDFDDNGASMEKNPLYKKIVYTPTAADKGVILFRDWLRLKAGGIIPYKGGYRGMPSIDNEVVFDQWNSHTTKCKKCLNAYKNAKKLRVASAALAIALTLWRPGGKISASVSVGTLCGISYISHKITKALRRMEFSHAEND